MPTHPWNDIDLIEKNLMNLATLGRGHKLARPDSTGAFRVSTSDRGREAADSITSLRPLIKQFLKRAILVAACSEFPAAGKTQGLIQAVSSVGFTNLLTTYSRDSFFNRKTDQRDAVSHLIEYLRVRPGETRTWMEDAAQSAFGKVREKYAAGSKSSNKRYQVKPGGKYTAPGVPAVNSNKKMTLAGREAMARNAHILLSQDRGKITAEEIAQSYATQDIDSEIVSSDALIRGYNVTTINVDKVYDDLTPEEKKDVKAALAADGAAMEAAYQKTREKLSLFKMAREIHRKGTQYVHHDRWAAKAGNCDELATLACLFLEEQHVPFVSKVSLSRAPGQLVEGEKGDHVFAVVGLRLVGKQTFMSTNNTGVVVTPAQRRAIPGARVIDPWANLHCSVAEYPSRFRAKMAEWSTQGKQIGVGTGWIDPDPATTGWYARTIAELDWVITRYRGYDNEVFNREEYAEAQQFRQRMAAQAGFFIR